MNFLDELAAAKLSYQASAQGVHTCIGVIAVLLTAYLHGNTLYAGLGMTGLAALIEFWFDATYEKQPFWDNFEDFAFYCLGTWGTFGLLKL